MIVTITNSGSSNFAVWTLDADLQETDLLGNTIGNYKGTRPLDFDGGETQRLKIDSNGKWVVKIARSPTRRASTPRPPAPVTRC